jgi:hypothetical protein
MSIFVAAGFDANDGMEKYIIRNLLIETRVQVGYVEDQSYIQTKNYLRDD